MYELKFANMSIFAGPACKKRSTIRVNYNDPKTTF